jgi:hypothetical protein
LESPLPGIAPLTQKEKKKRKKKTNTPTTNMLKASWICSIHCILGNVDSVRADQAVEGAGKYGKAPARSWPAFPSKPQVLLGSGWPFLYDQSGWLQCFCPQGIKSRCKLGHPIYQVEELCHEYIDYMYVAQNSAPSQM